MDDISNIFAQEAFWEGGGGSFFTVDHCLVIAAALTRLSKIVTTLCSEFADLIKGLVDEVMASHAATTKAGKEAERQKGFVSIAKMAANDGLNEVASLRGRVGVSRGGVTS